jgi:Mg-chelatase subunit ChlI
MGVNVVEREGISFQHPASFILIGTMNPEEGELRPQLIDRFGLSVEVRGLLNSEERLEVLERHIAFDQNPNAFYEAWMPYEQELSERIAAAYEIVDQVRYTRNNLRTIAKLTGSLQIDGHRADLVILKAARTNAAFEGRHNITPKDILMAAELALPHRIKRGPFSDDTLDVADLQTRLDDIESDEEPESTMETQQQSQGTPKKKTWTR